MLGAMGRPRWTAGEIAAAPPEVIAAARWELYAHRLWPAAAADSLAGPDKPLKPDDQVRQRVAARRALNTLRRALTLVDEPDDGPALPDVEQVGVEELLAEIRATVDA